MAIHKFNRLQVHLTDNEGWRIEIKKYPKLTELGSKMDWNLCHKGGTGAIGLRLSVAQLVTVTFYV